jgi:adenylosuccinate lyase
MQELWSEETKFRLWLEVELAVMEAYEALGIIPVVQQTKQEGMPSWMWKK